jgi:hypothetical protein
MLLALLSACSWNSAKHTAFETVESIRIQQCLDHRDDPDCSTERKRYESYDAERQHGTRE